MSIHFFSQLSNVLAVSSTKEDGPMGSSTNPGPNGEFFKNSTKFMNGFGIDAKERLVRAGQVHGATVRWVPRLPPADEITGSDGSVAKVRRIANVDGLVTYNPVIVLGIVASDCFPLFFYYPPPSHFTPLGIIGLAHAGRKGTMQNIAGEAVSRMHLTGAAKLGEIRVAVGPGICVECHKLYPERDAEDIAFFKMAHPKLVKPIDGVVHVDLVGVIKKQLIQAGINAGYIEISGECTACPKNREKFFSYRRDNGQAGNVHNMLSIIGFRRRG